MAIHLKDKKGVTTSNVFQKNWKESKIKPNNIWVDKGSKFDNRSIKSWLEKNVIEMYSTLNEGRPIVDEGLVRSL